MSEPGVREAAGVGVAPAGSLSARGGIVALLDRESPADYRREWTTRIAAGLPDEQSETRSLLIFRIGEECLGLHTTVIREVVPSCPLHVLPHRGGILLGLAAVRGQLVVCINLAAVLGLAPSSDTAVGAPGAGLRQTIVADWQGNQITFPVDGVYGIHRYQQQELRDVPATLADASIAFTNGLLSWREITVGCLDEQLLFRSLDKGLS